MPIQPRTPVAAVKPSRYQNDAKYRARAKVTSRLAYRKKKGMETTSCLYSLEFLDNIAGDYQIKHGRKTVTIKGFSVPQAASALQQLYQTVWRWLQNGVIPAPRFTCINVKGPRSSFPVYHLEEVRILIEEIGNHEKVMAYFRKDHTEVRARIEQRFLAFRRSLKL